MTGATRIDPAPVVVADGLTLADRRGSVFADLHFSWPAHELSAITGPSGSGRSSLLLSVAGRMQGLSGKLTVAGIDAVARAQRVRAVTAIARIARLVELEKRLTVGESITERALIDAVSPRHAEEVFAELEDRLGIGFRRQDLVDDLTAYDQTVLAVALATVRPSRLIVLDDADAHLDLDDQLRLVDALRAVCATGPAIAISTTEVRSLPADVSRVALARVALARPVRPSPPSRPTTPADTPQAAHTAAPKD